jgi:hypothetical protein
MKQEYNLHDHNIQYAVLQTSQSHIKSNGKI